MKKHQIKKYAQSIVEGGMLHSVAAFLFLASIMLSNQISSVITTGFFYVCSVAACLVACYGNGKEFVLPKSMVYLLAMIAVTGLINIFYTGNSTINKQLYTILSIGIGLLLLDERVDKRVFLWIFLLNALIVIIRILQNGTRGPIYISSSVNFVSVHLLCPLVLYYSTRERLGEKIVLWPAFIAWVLCLTVQGRAGILFLSFFFGGLLILRGLPIFIQFDRKKKIICCAVLAGVITLAVVLAVVFDVVNTVEIFSRFAQFGLSGNGRGPIWGDYVRRVFTTGEAFFLGPNLDSIQRVVNHEGNLHNSFLNIYAYNGLVAFVTVIALCAWAAWDGLKKRNWVYLLCFATFCLRGFTDYVFWGSTATPILFFFILRPFAACSEEKCWIINFQAGMNFVIAKKNAIKNKLSRR